MSLKKHETRAEFVAEAEAYRPASMPTIEWAAHLEKGWQAHRRLHGIPAPRKPSGTMEEEVEAAEYRGRARRAAEEFRQVCPASPFSFVELVAGQLAEWGRDETGRTRAD